MYDQVEDFYAWAFDEIPLRVVNAFKYTFTGKGGYWDTTPGRHWGINLSEPLLEKKNDQQGKKIGLQFLRGMLFVPLFVSVIVAAVVAIAVTVVLAASMIGGYPLAALVDRIRGVKRAHVYIEMNTLNQNNTVQEKPVQNSTKLLEVFNKEPAVDNANVVTAPDVQRPKHHRHHRHRHHLHKHHDRNDSNLSSEIISSHKRHHKHKNTPS